VVFSYVQFAKLLKDYASPLENHDDGSKDFVSYKVWINFIN